MQIETICVFRADLSVCHQWFWVEELILFAVSDNIG